MKVWPLFVILPLFLPLYCVAETPHSTNPFSAFFGQWTLKEHKFQQVWDTKTVQTLSIPGHHTRCEQVNTSKSVLCVVTAGDLQGHILWSFNDDTSTVHHLSHFGSSRNGVGSGTLDSQANLTTRVTFQGEPENTYRVYEYTWLSKDEYSMVSRQYDENHQLTGNWYGGTFVRLTNESETESNGSQHSVLSDKQQVQAIFKAADSQSPEGLEHYLSHVAEDVELMPHGAPLVVGKDGYREHVKAGWLQGKTKIRHELIALDTYADSVVARGRAVGTFQPKGSDEAFAFSTKNLFVFKRNAGNKLKVHQVIFNMDPQ